MKKLISTLIAVAISCLFSFADEQNDCSTVYVGGIPILLPAPKGYFRIDGKSERIDSILRASVGKDVRPVAWYGSEVALAETLAGKMSADRGINFQALTGTLIEKTTIPESKFQSFKKDVIQDSNGFVDDVEKKNMEAAGSEAMSILLRKVANVRVGEMIPLGVYDESPESISYSFLMKMESLSADGKSKVSTVFVGAHSYVLLRGHLIDLSCGTNYHNPPEITSVRNLLKKWKDSIVLLNK